MDWACDGATIVQGNSCKIGPKESAFSSKTTDGGPVNGCSQLKKQRPRLTSSGTGPDEGVAAPMPFGGSPMLHFLNLNSVARSGARGVGLLE
jgi:hypothetical protein